MADFLADFLGGIIELIIELFLEPWISQIPRSKLRGIKFAAQQSCGVFDPRGIRQISVQARLLGSLLRGNKAAAKLKYRKRK
ncbi:MAG: hypothetical protein Q4C59_10855 [Lachnospiraceae bacterium]|nr:hypothetical protein [Lachnospiraceae bacterium]